MRGERFDSLPAAHALRRGGFAAASSGPDGEVTPARIQFQAVDGRGYAPHAAFHRVLSSSETHYFHSDGTFEVEVPSGRTTVEALKGFGVHARLGDGRRAERWCRGDSARPRAVRESTCRGLVLGRHPRPRPAPGRLGLTQKAFFLRPRPRTCASRTPSFTWTARS